MKKIIQLKLKFFAKRILAKYRPEVVGITGSVGKTSAKEAVYTVLAGKFRARRSMGNYNNEIGVPLTIIGADSPGRSVFGWIRIFWRAGKLILIKDKNYPRILILEMGVDRPGDMRYLNSIAKCKIGIVTLIGSAHLEFFGTIDKIKNEKGRLIKNLLKEGTAILNYDNKKTREIINFSKVKILTYGFDERAKVRAIEINFSFKNAINKDISGINEVNLAGTSFKLGYNGSFVPVLLPRVVGNGAIYAALAGASVGLAMGMNLVEITQRLRRIKPLQGRMRLLSGIKHTLIIDDTYNSSPQASIAALDIIKIMPLSSVARKFAVLGDMLELGRESEAEHRSVGRHLVKCGIDKLIVVGERARDIARGAKKAGMKQNNIFNFSDPDAAGRFLQERIKQGDLILIKGSQGIRMEKVVKEIMAEPLRAKELLVRQGKEWA